MRQAGRYLPEYTATRGRAGSFMALATNPALATEVTLQPLERFPLDAAILFSDILTVPDAMGLGLYFAEGEGPRFERPLRDEKRDRRAFGARPPRELRYVLDAVREIRRALAGRVPLIGFSGSPYTLACYMVEGAAATTSPRSRCCTRARSCCIACSRSTPRGHRLPERADRGRRAGGDAVRHLGRLPAPAAYDGSRLHRCARSRGGYRGTVPTILFTKGGGGVARGDGRRRCDCVGLDWTVGPRRARRAYGARVALQGNLDPLALLTDPR